MYSRYAIDNTIFKIAIYIRLSREDGDDMESESVTNQRSLLIGYLKAQGLVAVDIYVDDGYTGTNFERPEFKRMLNDIENGKINMVITKDLSRLGRDHIMTGYYVETFFPENDVRYVAVNDDIDTFFETSGSDMMPFRLSMNDGNEVVVNTLNIDKLNNYFEVLETKNNSMGSVLGVFYFDSATTNNTFQSFDSISKGEMVADGETTKE